MNIEWAIIHSNPDIFVLYTGEVIDKRIRVKYNNNDINNND